MKLKNLWAAVLLLTLTSFVLAQEARREIHFPDLPGGRTLKCDLHTHTVFSDGSVWPTVRVDEAWREGLDALSITDHIEYQPHKQDVPTAHNRPYELAVGRARERNILLIRGTEITRDTPPGHFNAIFLKDVNPLDTKDFYEVFEQANRQEAFVFWNHPGWQGPERGRWGQEQTTLYERKRMHAIEICNGDEYYPEAHGWAVEKNLVLVGNSDIHGPSDDHLTRTVESHRTLTLVLAREKTVESLREALLAGRTAVWYRNRLIGREAELAPLFAACVQIRPAHSRSDKIAWAEVVNHCELDITLEAVDQARPARIHLPARSTSLVRFEQPANDAPQEGWAYRATNFIVAPEQPLEVRLTLP